MTIWKNKIGKVVAFSVFASVISVTPIATAENSAPSEPDHNFSTQVDESLLPSEQDIQDMRDEMTSRGISNEDQEAIVEKVRQGELPDADNPDVEPIQVSESPEDSEVQVLKFPDGSIAYTSIGGGESVAEDGHARIQARSTVGSEGCHRYWYNSGWERWDHCLIQYSGIAFKYSFRADVSLPHNSNGRGIIRRVWEPTVWKAFGHTVQNANVSIIQSWEDKKTGTPAKAQMRATLQVAKVFSTKTIALTLKITGRKVSIIPTM